MNVFFGISQIKTKMKNPVMAIGVFDGLHYGHQRLIHSAIKRAKAIHGTSMVMTFSPHPVHVLRPDIKLPLIISLAHRIKLIEQMGIDACVVVRFSKKFSMLTPEQFIKRYVVDKIGAKEVIVGDDFRFGHDRAGTLDYFKKAAKQFGFKLRIIQAVKGGKKVISSTSIRTLISQGELRKARNLLDRHVSILGTVAKGDSRGKTLGFPTANINPENELLPPQGVYVVQIRYRDQLYQGVANVGQRPSFKKNGKLNIEVHLFDFNKNIYNKEIVVEFLKKIREEKHFTSPKNLIAQIKQDEKRAKKWLTSR